MFKFVSDSNVVFGIYGENDGYLYLPMTVYDDEDNENYTALILRKDHPHFKDVVSEFTQTVNMLNNKPENSGSDARDLS